MPYVKRDWKIWCQRTYCTDCEYYNECLMEHDCKALQVLVKIHEDMDSGNPDE